MTDLPARSSPDEQAGVPGGRPLVFARPVEPHTSFEGIETDDERALRARVRALAWERFEHRREETDANGRCHELMPELGEAGLLGTLLDPTYGGTGEGLATSVVIAEELGGVIPSLAAMRAISGIFVGKPLEYFGTQEQRETYLPPLARGEWTTALAITEPDAGSDVAGMRTRAVKDGSGWILDGVKHHISGAAEARFLLLFARTSEDGPLNTALTAFLVPADAPGLRIERAGHYMGVSGLSHTRLVLEGAAISDEQRLGEVGDGVRVMRFGLATERIDIAARALGCATRAFEEARSFAASREQFGAPLRKKQAVSHRVAAMRAEIDAGRLLVTRAARVYDEVLRSSGAEAASEACNIEAAIAKLFCAERGFWVCDQAMQTLGGIGYKHGAAVEAMFRDCRVFRYGGGTDDIMRHIIQQWEFASIDARPEDRGDDAPRP